MQLFTDGAGDLLMTGQKCWVDMPKHMEFAGDVMWAEVIEGHRDPQEGHIFVRQLATPAMPNPGEQGGWVSEQPLIRVQGAR
jgi:hypothetical protein